MFGEGDIQGAYTATNAGPFRTPLGADAAPLGDLRAKFAGVYDVPVVG